MQGPKAGDIAPDFTLPGVPDREYRLSAQRGKRVVLAFYPGDFTPICTAQLASYQDQWPDFEKTGALLWGISVDDLERHERFAKARALGFPLLGDLDGSVSRLFGVQSMLGTSKRSVFVIDGNGKVVWRRDEPMSITYAEMDEIIAHLRSIDAADGASPVAG